MDYKEYWQAAYESLEEELGREPTLDEIRNMEQDIGGSLIDYAEAYIEIE